MQRLSLKESVAEWKILTLGEVRTHKHFFFCSYNTVLLVTCFYKICGLPITVRLLKILFPFRLEWRNVSNGKYKKSQNFTS